MCFCDIAGVELREGESEDMLRCATLVVTEVAVNAALLDEGLIIN